MDKAVIFQPFEFIGFHLCSKLLEEGISVSGINILTEKTNDHEEKLDEIGRNANFALSQLADLDRTCILSADFVFLPLYDWFMAEKENVILAEPLKKAVLAACENTKVIVIAPLQLAMNDSAKYVHFYHQFSEDLIKVAELYQTFYLPSIYGPWQPENFHFQSLIMEKILKSRDTHSLSEREWEKDTIYIHDVLNIMMNTIDEGKKGKYICKSEGDNQWAEGLRALGEKNRETSLTSFKFDDPYSFLSIKASTTIENGLKRQKEHSKRIMDLRNFYR